MRTDSDSSEKLSGISLFQEEKILLKGIEEELYKRWQEIKKKILANHYHQDIDDFGYILLWMKKFLPEVIDNNERLYEDISNFLKPLIKDETFHSQYWHLVLPFGIINDPHAFIPFAEANLNHHTSTIRGHVQNCILLQENWLHKQDIDERIESNLDIRQFGYLLELFCAVRGYEPFPDQELAKLFHDNEIIYVYLQKNEEENFARFKNGDANYFSFQNKFYQTYAGILENVTAILFDSSFNRAKYNIEQPSLFPSSLFTETLNERLSRSITNKPYIKIERDNSKMLHVKV
jgi:hypothetical protein